MGPVAGPARRAESFCGRACHSTPTSSPASPSPTTPYEVWQDLHDSFLPQMRELINAQVLPRYFVKIEEHIYIHELPTNGRRLLGQADRAVAPGAEGGRQAAATATLEAPAYAVSFLLILFTPPRRNFL